MTTIKTNCPTCGEVDLTPDDIELHPGPDAGQGSFYAFGCPGCQGLVRKEADERVVRLLVSAGVSRVVAVAAPQSQDPPLTYDDLLDLHALLATDAWFDDLLDLVHP
ncbi:MAG: hypothetical protein WD080_04355 [Egibacteraceae bacterium]